MVVHVSMSAGDKFVVQQTDHLVALVDRFPGEPEIEKIEGTLIYEATDNSLPGGDFYRFILRKFNEDETTIDTKVWLGVHQLHTLRRQI
jgi:hypothetical protein